ncbi:Hormone-sensitive lipase [Thelohanellus kitauei]|uniref:Hormone-sensitive lipase n=1 Tax=Thelohanellus kitauei TaxID=669202 RepID=A0A0C2IGF9_THEKT|nr:Hormone-sensitive lipase [Thelohanellus kitauei]
MNENNPMNGFLTNHISFFPKSDFYGKYFCFQFKRDVSKFLNIFVSSLAAYEGCHEKNSSIFLTTCKLLKQGSYLILNPKKKPKKLKQVYTNPTLDFVKSFLSLSTDVGIDPVSSLTYRNIEFRHSFCLEVSPLEIRNNLNEKIEILSQLTILKDKSDLRIQCHILSCTSFEGQKSFIKPEARNTTENPDCDNLILYYHGGAFITSSTKSSEAYLREWTVQLNCPIVSVDYSLSPEAIFPQAVQECFYVYCWILKNKHNVGWNGKSIIVSGDSAGASLAFSVTQLAIVKEIRIPDGIVCAYPSCCTLITNSPSRMLIHIDPLLSFGFLNVARNAYFGVKRSLPNNSDSGIVEQRKQEDNKELKINSTDEFYRILGINDTMFNFYLKTEVNVSDFDETSIDCFFESLENDSGRDSLASPIFTEDEILQRFPPVRIMVSDMDPLLDEEIEMCKKLSKNKVDVKIDVVEDFPHGFMAFYATSDEVKKAGSLIIARFIEIFQII